MLMSKPEFIDLSSTNDDFDFQPKIENVTSLNKNFVKRPISTALKSIGLGLIKMQFSENVFTPIIQDIHRGKEIKKNEEDIWQSAWTEEQGGPCNYQFRHFLESRHDKAYKCVLCRSRFCENQAKMTRLNWIHHARRGHVRINSMWRKILKKNNNANVGNVFEIYCVLCNKNKKPVTFTPSEFLQHIKKQHSQFLPYNEYTSYFQRCFICNDQTKSFHQNLSHRQLCLAALVKDPNQAGTEHFNNCFNIQRHRQTFSLELGISQRNGFNVKLKQYNSLKNTSFYLWLQLKRNETLRPPAQNGWKPKPSPRYRSLPPLQNISTNKLTTNSKMIFSDRVPPGSQIDLAKIHKFFIPVPFLIKNEIETKKAYVKWRKSIKEEHSKIQSNVPWYCEICNAMLKNMKTAYCHIRMCHKSAGFQESTCKSCNKRFLTNEGFKNHFLGMKKCPVTRKCAECNASVSINDIYEHMFLKHKNELKTALQLKTCMICRSDVDNIENHLFDIHGMSNLIQAQPDFGKKNYRNGSFFNCPKCSLTYFSEVELRNHMITNDHCFECPKCPTLKFYLSWELMNHLSVTHKSDENDEKLTCDLCDTLKINNSTVDQKVAFGSSSELVRHFIEKHISPCSVLLSDVTKTL